LIIAAEASSAQCGEKILERLLLQDPGARCFGIGSKRMESLGFECLGYAEDLAVMGLVEVLKNFSRIKKVFNQVVDRAQKDKPQVALLMDYPGFNLRLAKKLKTFGIPCVYFIPPQVWAWKKSRIHQIKAYFDEVLTLFPFEQKFFQNFEVPCQCVGHPLVKELNPNWLSPKHRQILKEKSGVPQGELILGVMPGSRLGEVELNFPTQLETLAILHRRDPKLNFLIMVAPTRVKEDLYPYLEGVQFPYIIQKKDPWEMIATCDAVLAVSGTASLQVGLLQVPMVIHYRFRWLTYIIGRFLVRKLSFFGLPNIILGREVVPERLQGRANPPELARLIETVLKNEAEIDRVKKDLSELSKQLGQSDPIEKVVATLLSYSKRGAHEVSPPA
jgi:lipid-A-disaccharide synthase